MKDYLAYLEGNPRYGKVFEPTIRGSVDKLADAIGYSGYSDDPVYGQAHHDSGKVATHRNGPYGKTTHGLPEVSSKDNVQGAQGSSGSVGPLHIAIRLML